MSHQTNPTKTQYLQVFTIVIIITVGGVLFDRYLKDNDIRDTYGETVDKLHQEMNTMSCDELLERAYENPMYGGPRPEQTYATNLAREKCLLDKEWKNPEIKIKEPEIKIKEPVSTMDELYDSWEKKK